MSFPSLLAYRLIEDVGCHIFARGSVVQAYVAGKKVRINGLPPSISPLYMESVRELLNSSKTCFSWDGKTVTVALFPKGVESDSEDFAKPDQQVGDYAEAIEYYTLDLVRGLNNLGTLYAAQRDYPKAVAYYTDALDRIGDGHSYGVSILINLGTAFHFQNNYPMAIENFNKALKLQTDIFGTGQHHEALILMGLGNVYIKLGENDKAIDCYNKGLAIQKQLFGENHPDVARVYNNLGGAFHSKKDYERAIEYHTKSLFIRKQFFGEYHSEVLTSLTNLGNSFHAQKVAFCTPPAQKDHAEATRLPSPAIFTPSLFLNSPSLCLKSPDLQPSTHYFTKLREANSLNNQSA